MCVMARYQCGDAALDRTAQQTRLVVESRFIPQSRSKRDRARVEGESVLDQRPRNRSIWRRSLFVGRPDDGSRTKT